MATMVLGGGGGGAGRGGAVFPVREQNIAGVNKGDGKVTITLKH